MSDNPKVVGAIVIGFALVGGAYVVANLSAPPPQQQSAGVVVERAPARLPIPVTDSNDDGLEDWRNSLEIGGPVELSTAPEKNVDYVLPETLTGDFSINFFEQAVRSQMYGQLGSGDEVVIEKSLAEAAQEASDTLYDERDITIINDSEEAIRAYANRAANILFDNEVPSTQNETEILKIALEQQDRSRLEEIRPRSQMYAALRDQYLATPVPLSLAQQHLDLINVFNALHNDIEAMLKVFDDPLMALLRIKRYQDDATGLTYGLSNMYQSLARFPQAFRPNDPALVFIGFAPVTNNNQ